MALKGERPTKHFLTESELRNLVYKDYEIFREGCQGSPSIRQEILNKMGEYFKGGSLTKTRIDSILKDLAFKRFQPGAEGKEAQRLYKFLEVLKRKVFP